MSRGKTLDSSYRSSVHITVEDGAIQSLTLQWMRDSSLRITSE